jgi:hypothetical protein
LAGFSTAAGARRDRATSTATLSVVVMTAGPAARVAAILELLRPAADEILVALDDRADEATRRAVTTVADRVVVYPFAEPVDRPLPWLFHQCRGDWMLTIDDDEVPSAALLDVLPALLSDERVAHYSVARRWVYPDSATFLDDAPWHPDYQLRLFRTDSRLVRFSDALHRPIHAAGPGRFVPEPLWHLDTVLRTREQRERKAAHYEAMRPGLRAGGRSLNYGFYVPELRDEPRLTPLPPAERELVDAVLTATEPTDARTAAVSSVTSEELDAWWPQSRRRQAGTIALADVPASFAAGEERSVDATVSNTGDDAWDWGTDAVVAVRCASYWEPDDHRSAAWTPLPAPLAPGESMLVPVHVHAPATPGRHVLRLALVQEGVGWLADELCCRVEVRPARSVAFLYASAADVAAAIAADPDVAPFVVDDPLPAGRISAALAALALVLQPQRGLFGGADRLVVGGAAPARRRSALVATAVRLAARRRGIEVV